MAKYYGRVRRSCENLFLRLSSYFVVKRAASFILRIRLCYPGKDSIFVECRNILIKICIFFAELNFSFPQMTSTERIFEYCELAPEPDTKSNDSISADWPKHGEIKADHASFSYHEDLPVVLKDLSFCINAGEKVGVVGRTGAGKSSLISAMFRMGHLVGTIKIDDVATSEISLLDLRGHLSVIPQVRS